MPNFHLFLGGNYLTHISSSKCKRKCRLMPSETNLQPINKRLNKHVSLAFHFEQACMSAESHD